MRDSSYQNGEQHNQFVRQSQPDWPVLQTILFGLAVLLVMLWMAYGISGIAFGVVGGAFAFVLVFHRYRFRLRTLLLYATLICVWLGLGINRHNRHERAITGVAEAGGALQVVDRQPDFPWAMWAERYNIDFYSAEKSLTDDSLAHLRAISPARIVRLDVSNTGIGGTDIGFLEHLTDLEVLTLGNRTYGDGKRITGLSQNDITDQSLKHLANLTRLIFLDLGGTDITDDGLRHLAGMSALRTLYLHGTDITGTGIQHIAPRGDLMLLNLSGCPLTEEGVLAISGRTDVSSLDLSHTGITDQSLKHLTRMKQLTSLTVIGTEISDAAVASYRAKLPQCKVRVKSK